MAKPDVLIFHYGEIALKTGNRLFFEKHLARNIASVLADAGIGNVTIARGRIFAKTSGDFEFEKFKKRLPFLFGVVYASLAVRVAPEAEKIVEAAVEMMHTAPEGSFKADVMRSDKRFASTSMEMNALIGEKVIEATGRKVNVRNPDVICAVEILEKDAYVSVEQAKGPGGLPTGSQAPLMVMLSGGIDSPVAALRMQRRGAAVAGIHFHSYPITSRASLDKVKDLAKVIATAQGGIDIYMVPFAEVQKAAVKFAPPELRVVLYRRSMYRIAAAAAAREGVLAMATGESLGQVASQTVENIVAVTRAIDLPVLRPLIAMNKEEIMVEARTYGTYDISIRPHEDCCSLFLPEHPETRARLDRVLDAEAKIENLGAIEKDAIDNLEKIRIA